MSTTTEVATPTGAPTQPRGNRLLRVIGWTLIVAGLVVLLYVIYTLFFTGLETGRAQAEMREAWPGDRAAEQTGTTTPDVGDAVAMLEFHRPGADPPVKDEPLFVVEGVTLQDLTRGPGHYPDTAMPGADGNFAVAGHRTTYGAPFFRLDELRAGDEIHVTDRDGEMFVYEFVELQVVNPHDAWVLGPDPLELGEPMVTLTACHPRFSARQRLIAFAELAS